MQTELSTLEIVKAANDIKSMVENFDKKRFLYTIYALNPTVSAEAQIVVMGDNKEGSCFRRFSQELDTLMSNPNNVYLKFIFKSGNGKVIANPELPIKIQTYGSPVVLSQTNATQPQQSATPVVPAPLQSPLHQQQTQAEQPKMNNVSNILALMGYDMSGLGNAEDPLGGLGTVMAVRDANIRKEFEDRDKQRRYDDLLTEKAKLEVRVEQLEKENVDKTDEIESLNSEIEELNSQIEEYEKLNPENSFMGVGLTGLGVKILNSFARKNSKAIAKIAKIDEASLLGLLDEGEEQNEASATPSLSNVEVQPVDNSPRSKQCEAVCQFMKSLSDEDFEMFWALIGVFAQDNSTIKQVVNWSLRTTNNEEK